MKVVIQSIGVKFTPRKKTP